MSKKRRNNPSIHVPKSFLVEKTGLSFRFWHADAFRLFSALFIICWLICWTVGCVILVGRLVAEPSLPNFVVAVPFWTGWVFVSFFLLPQTVYREQVQLDKTGFRYYKWPGLFSSRIFVPLTDIRAFKLVKYSWKTKMGQPVYCVRLYYAQDSLDFLVINHRGDVLEWVVKNAAPILKRLKETDSVLTTASDLVSVNLNPPRYRFWTCCDDAFQVVLTETKKPDWEMTGLTLFLFFFISPFWLLSLLSFFDGRFNKSTVVFDCCLWISVFLQLLLILLATFFVALIVYTLVCRLLLDYTQRQIWISLDQITERITLFGISRKRIILRSKIASVHLASYQTYWNSNYAEYYSRRFALNFMDSEGKKVGFLTYLSRTDARSIEKLVQPKQEQAALGNSSPVVR